MNVIITDAGRGLGLEMVRRHLRAGDTVLVLAHSLTDELAKSTNCKGIRHILASH